MREYVLGFALSHDGQVALIRKNAPTWQAGRLNGIGGKVEPGEGVIAAMVREFREEAGIDTYPEEWSLRVVMQSENKGGCNSPLDPHGYKVYTFVTHLTKDRFDAIKTMTEEQVEKHVASDVGRLNVVNSVNWLVPFLRASDICEGPHFVNYNK